MILLTGAAQTAVGLNMNIGTFVIMLFCIIAMVEAASTFIKKFIISPLEKKIFKNQEDGNLKEKVDKLSEEVEKLKEGYKELKDLNIEQEIGNSHKTMIAINEAIIEILYDRISQRCRVYINELKGIPEDEVENFQRTVEAYRACGGNHGLETKYEYCIEKLPIIPPTIPKK